MDRFGPTGKVSKKRVHLLRWSSFPGRTGWNFGSMDRALYFTYILILFLFAELKQAIHPVDPHPLYPPCIRNRLFATSPDVDREYWKTDYLIKKNILKTEGGKFLLCRAGVRLRLFKSGICFAISGAECVTNCKHYVGSCRGQVVT